MTWLYFASLLLSTGCMALLDRRYRLFWFARPARAALVHFSGLVFFLAWDLVGIHFEVFARGDSPYMTGIEVAPELPLEEIFFLFFLCWVTMVVCAGGARILELISSRGGGPVPTPGPPPAAPPATPPTRPSGEERP